jgi:hypothetical protein
MHFHRRDLKICLVSPGLLKADCLSYQRCKSNGTAWAPPVHKVHCFGRIVMKLVLP